jgi:hypothetical protein
MRSIIVLPTLALLAFTIYKVTLSILKTLRQNRKAKALGCKHPPTLPSADPFGIQMAIDTTKANANKRMPTWAVGLIQEMCQTYARPCLTFYLKFPPGTREIFTVDPRNVQTVLATKFKDFELPGARVGNFGPLLGRGIVRTSKDREFS